MMILRGCLVACFCTAAVSCSSVTSSEMDHSARALAADPPVPRSVFNVKASNGGLTVVKATEPDPRARFQLHYQANAFSADTIIAEVADDGLLKSVSATTEDKSPDIAVNLAEIVFTFGTDGAVAGRSLPIDAPLGSGNFYASYDPLDPRDVARTRHDLAQAGFCILVGEEASIGPAACNLAIVPSGGLARAEDASERLTQRSGVFYRQASPVAVQIYHHGKTNAWETLFAGNETLFDKSEVYEVAMRRAAFVEKKVEITFQNGALSKVSITKPSEILALSTAGLNIVRRVISIPFEAAKQDTQLINAKTDRIKAQTELLRKQDELLKLRVEQQGSTQKVLVPSSVDYQEAGARALGTAGGPGNALEICGSQFAASVADCRAFVERGSGGF